MFQYMKRHLLLVSVFTVGSIGLTSSARGEIQNTFGGSREGAQLECICVQEIGGVVECAWDVGPCADFASTCTASGDPACPHGLCLTAAYTGCPTNTCLVQDPYCNNPCPVQSVIGNIVHCELKDLVEGACEKLEEDVEFDGKIWDSFQWCVPDAPDFDFNRVDIHVGKPDQAWKLQDAVGVCKANGVAFQMFFKDHEKDVDENPDHEVWGGDIPENCKGSVDVYLQVDPNRPPDWNPVIKVVFFEHRGTPKIPTLPEWGLVGLTLLVLTAATVVFGRRRRAAA